MGLMSARHGSLVPSRLAAEDPDVAQSGLLGWMQSVVDREHRKLETAGYTELVEDVGEVILDGLAADRESIRNLFVPCGVDNERDDFEFAVGQAEILRRALIDTSLKIVERRHDIRHRLSPDP